MTHLIYQVRAVEVVEPYTLRVQFTDATEQWAMVYDLSASDPNRPSVRLGAIQPRPRLTATGVSVTPPPAFPPARSHTLPHAPGNRRESVAHDATPEPRQTFG